MKSIQVTQKTLLVRHWFKWYRVSDSGKAWEPLKMRRPVKPLEEVATSLKKAGF